MKMLAISILLMSSLTSCAFLGSGQNSVDLNCAIIHGVTKSTTTLALETIYEDLEERLDAAKDLVVAMDTYVLPILSNPQAIIDEKGEELLFDKIPEQYRFYLDTAFQALNDHYVSPKVGEALSNEHVRYLRSFFSGLRQAGSDMLRDNNSIIRMRVEVERTGLTTPY